MAIVTGTNSSETLNGTSQADIVRGLGGDDELYGWEGNDTLKGGGGADELYGWFGNDTADYSDSAGYVVVSLKAGKGFYNDAQGASAMAWVMIV